MPRYTDIDRLLEAFDENEPMNWNNTEVEIQEQMDFRYYRGLVENADAVDVVKVRHGAWVEENDGTHSCSECGQDATYTYDGTEVCGIVCPHCATVMDEKTRK